MISDVTVRSIRFPIMPIDINESVNVFVQGLPSACWDRLLPENN